MSKRHVTCVCETKPTQKRFRDLTGRTFERLTVEDYHGYRKTAGGVKHFWRCTCSCGTTDVIVGGGNLKLSGGTKSCGCKRAELSRERRLRHGETSADGRRSKEYRIWQGMLNRCRNKNDPAYPDYGGRGIKVCRRWLKFETFFDDMGRCPPLKSLDRTDNDGPYSSDNCEWRTQKQQCRNRRSNRLITYGGRTMCVAAWAERIGLEYGTLLFRIKRWSIAKAMTTPKLR